MQLIYIYTVKFLILFFLVDLGFLRNVDNIVVCYAIQWQPIKLNFFLVVYITIGLWYRVEN